MIFKIFSRNILIMILLVVGIFLLMPMVLHRFYLYLLTLILITGLLATSLNMVLGFGGMYQFNHAVFYGISAYTVAIILTRTQLPAWIAFVSGPIVASIFGLIIGAICVRLSKLYFGMLQISLGSLVWAVVFRWYSFTGGDDGIHGCPIPKMIYSPIRSYYFVMLIVGISLFIMYLIVNSPFGRIFQGIRDNPERCEAIGIHVKQHQLIGQTIAAFFGGVAGMLFVCLEACVFPDLLFWTLSLEILIMCLLGGWHTFLGPMLGAAVMLSLRSIVGIYTEYWTIILGIVLMLLILFLPDGILGYVMKRFASTDKISEEN